jgi:uncharacterized protein with GYD domain
MPKYLIEASYTHEGVEGVRTKGGSSRRRAVAETAKSVGGKLEAVASQSCCNFAAASVPLTSV